MLWLDPGIKVEKVDGEVDLCRVVVHGLTPDISKDILGKVPHILLFDALALHCLFRSDRGWLCGRVPGILRMIDFGYYHNYCG